MGLKSRLGLIKKPPTIEIVPVGPQVLRTREHKDEVARVGETPIHGPKPVQQIPEEDIRVLLEGRAKREAKLLGKPRVKQTQAPEVKIKTEAKPPLRSLVDWIKNKKAERSRKKTAPKPVAIDELDWKPPVGELPKIRSPAATNIERVGVGTVEPQLDTAGPVEKSKGFVPDPPLKPKKGKSVAEVIKEKKKEAEPKPVKKLTYEEAVEAYERQASSGKKSSHKTKGKEAGAQQLVTSLAPELLTKKEIRTLKFLGYLPSRVKALLARRRGVAFTLMCGIYQYEYVWVAKDKGDAVRFMKGIKEVLNYESIVEIYRRKTRDVYVIYARAKMEQRGRYSGTPLHPRLEERF